MSGCDSSKPVVLNDPIQRPSGQVEVSVIIPTYSRPNQLRACLESLARQTLSKTRYEVIVVDDGSPNPLAEVAAEFPNRILVRYFRQPNAGPAAARNFGVKQSDAKWIAFIDDDCAAQPDWLAKLLAAQEVYPKSLVGGSTINGLPTEVFASTSQMIVDMVYEHFNSDPSNAYFLTSNNILGTREDFMEMGGFDTCFRLAGGEDRDFCDRWRLLGKKIVWQKDAVILHYHSQTLWQYIKLYFRYGIGAYLYQANRRERGSGKVSQEIGFHLRVLPKLNQHLAEGTTLLRRIQVLLALAVWQTANACGFFYQSLLQTLSRASSSKFKNRD